MAPRRRSTKRGPKIANKKMKGGKNWCCNGNECKEQGLGLTCLPRNVKYVCDDNVQSDNVTTFCKQAVFKGKNWCCNENKCKEQGWAPTCSPGNAKYVCDNDVQSDKVTTSCRQAVISIAANGTGLAVKEATKQSGNTLVNGVSLLVSPGGKKSKRRKSNKNRRTIKRK